MTDHTSKAKSCPNPCNEYGSTALSCWAPLGRTRPQRNGHILDAVEPQSQACQSSHLVPHLLPKKRHPFSESHMLSTFDRIRLQSSSTSSTSHLPSLSHTASNNQFLQFLLESARHGSSFCRPPNRTSNSSTRYPGISIPTRHGSETHSRSLTTYKAPKKSQRSHQQP